MHSDAQIPYELLGAEMDRWLHYRFEYIDVPGSCVDSVFWDMPCWDVQIAEHPATESGKPVLPILGMSNWCEQGIDILERLTTATRSRGLEVFWESSHQSH